MGGPARGRQALADGASPRPRRRLRLMVLLVALAFQVPQFADPMSTLAHCPGGTISYTYATSSRTLTNAGIKGNIDWTNPAVCALNNGSGTSAEWVTTCDWECKLGRDGWVQAGWIKRTGYSTPKGFCEIAASSGGSGFGPPPPIVEITLSSSTHLYNNFQTNSSWYCLIDSPQMIRTTSWTGFAYGDILIAGGETISPHSQIGKMAPGKLLLSNLQSWSGSGNYSTLDLVCCVAPVAPYGMDEPQAGQLRNWTNAH